MKRKIIFIVISLILCGIFGGLFIPQVILKSNNTYKGKEVFNTEQDYDNFKQALVTYNASWDVSSQGNTYVQALSSNPPIIVNFKIAVKNTINFPYGEKTNGTMLNLIPSILGFICVIVILYLGFTFSANEFWWLFKS